VRRSIAGHNPFNLFILTIIFSKNFTTKLLLKMEHMPMFVVKSLHIQINGQVYGSINRGRVGLLGGHGDQSN